ncbi:MAG: TIGR02281 family clan AA aspartic protease [Hyphomicrobiales bacterium]
MRGNLILPLVLAAIGTVLIILVFFPGAPQSVGLEDDDLARLGYLGGVLVLIGSGLSIRDFKARQFLRDAGIWLALGLALVVGYSSKDSLKPFFSQTIASLSPGTPAEVGDGRVAIKRNQDNDFLVKSAVNDASIEFIFDTGASAVVLTYDDAVKAGFSPEKLSFGITVSTANGTTQTAPIRIGVLEVGSIRRENVRGLIAQQGDLRTSLLGMTFMDTLTSYQVTGDTLEFQN